MKVNSKIFKKRIKELEKVPEITMSRSYTVLKNYTPVRSGNARNRTKLQKQSNTIKSNYGYAGRLDDGWSRQAKDGFTDPTIDFMDKTVDQLVGKV